LQRTNEGRAKTRAEGKPFGRRLNLTGHQRRETMKRLEAGETTREIALSYNVARTTIARLKPVEARLEPNAFPTGGWKTGRELSMIVARVGTKVPEGWNRTAAGHARRD
jgi:hypothetical protein